MQTGGLIIVIGLAVIMALSKLFLGIQGYRQASDKTKETEHITFDKVIFVISIFRENSDLCLNLFSLVVVFDYIKENN